MVHGGGERMNQAEHGGRESMRMIEADNGDGEWRRRMAMENGCGGCGAGTPLEVLLAPAGYSGVGRHWAKPTSWGKNYGKLQSTWLQLQDEESIDKYHLGYDKCCVGDWTWGGRQRSSNCWPMAMVKMEGSRARRAQYQKGEARSEAPPRAPHHPPPVCARARWCAYVRHPRCACVRVGVRAGWCVGCGEPSAQVPASECAACTRNDSVLSFVIRMPPWV
eukprot:gene25662-biopygen6022